MVFSHLHSWLVFWLLPQYLHPWPKGFLSLSLSLFLSHPPGLRISFCLRYPVICHSNIFSAAIIRSGLSGLDCQFGLLLPQAVAFPLDSGPLLSAECKFILLYLKWGCLNGKKFHHTELLYSRFVGVGEASFMSLAAPFIDDNAPPSQVYFYALTCLGIRIVLRCMHLCLNDWFYEAFSLNKIINKIYTFFRK